MLLLLLLVFRVNDIIVSVNGISTVNVTHGQAVDALKRAGNVVSLVRPPVKSTSARSRIVTCDKKLSRC